MIEKLMFDSGLGNITNCLFVFVHKEEFGWIECFDENVHRRLWDGRNKAVFFTENVENTLVFFSVEEMGSYFGDASDEFMIGYHAFDNGISVVEFCPISELISKEDDL